VKFKNFANLEKYMRLNNKVAIITGSGSGIGKAIVRLFSQEGAKVVIAEISEENGKKVMEEIRDNGGTAVFVKTDVSKSSEIKKMTELCLKEFGGIDVLVNNAGIVKFSPFHEVSEEDWDEVINVNLKSVFLASKSVLPYMLEKGKGKIINIASIAGLVGFENIGPYCASKGGIIALSKEMALEYAKKGININCIAPGVIETAMTRDMLNNSQTRQFLKSSTPYFRLGKSEDIAQAALYLASDESDFVNGEVLVVDGGWIAK